MWKGVLQGYMMHTESKEREADREEALRVREEDRAIRQSEFDRAHALNMAKFRADMLSKYGQTNENATELANLGARLSGVVSDPEIVNRIVGTGNVDQVKNVVGQFEKYYDAYLEQNPGRESEASQYLTDILQNSFEISPQGQEEVDLSSFQDLLGDEELPPIYRTTPGRVVGPRTVYAPQATPTEVGQVRRNITASYEEMANLEIQTVANALSNITENLQSSDPSIDRGALQADQELLIERRRMAQDAVSMANKDNPVFSPLLSLYGDDFIDNYLSESVPFSMTKANLGPAFANPPPPTRMTFVDEAQARRFKNYGLLSRGDIVIIGGEETVIN